MTTGPFFTLREALARRAPGLVAARQRARLAELVAFARAHSPYYRDHYRSLPERVDDHRQLPVTTKRELMARFDDWATDREVTLDRARAFAQDPAAIGERFLGRYTLTTTSGTTGTPGIFVYDDRGMAVASAVALRMLWGWLGVRGIARLVLTARRLAMTVVSGSHSATAVAAARLERSALGRRSIVSVPVNAPLHQIVERLNAFRPAVLAPHASVGKLLASEQEAGRLRIRPVLVTPAAEGLPASEYDRIARTFGATVGISYAATECPFLSVGCEHRWLHVTSDWAVLEPVGPDYRPTPPGEESHTVLLSNLANRLQPVLRYDLGDSVVLRPDPCPCGNPLPAVRVRGRAADVLRFTTDGGRPVSVPSLALELDEVPGLELSQVVQTTPTSLRVRLTCADGNAPERVWQDVLARVTRLLTDHGLGHVSVERAAEAPEQSSGGKYRRVIPLA